MPVCLTHHITWSVISVCHLFGKRAYATNDGSRNEWVVGLLAFGEGWHNNHHAFPRSAFHGLRWWQLDLYRIPPALRARRARTSQEGSTSVSPGAPVPIEGERGG